MPSFRVDIGEIDLELATRMRGRSYRDGDPRCPPLASLRRLCLHHRDFEGSVQEGVLVVAATVASELARIFERLFDIGFPIARMTLIDDFDGDDDASMAANNSSAFNFRTVAGTQTLSHHALGVAIDLNPVQNPMVIGDDVYPKAGAAYLDRSDVRPGMIVRPGPVVEAFESEGWHWGGEWPDVRDYHHFSRLPRLPGDSLRGRSRRRGHHR